MSMKQLVVCADSDRAPPVEADGEAPATGKGVRPAVKRDDTPEGPATANRKSPTAALQRSYFRAFVSASSGMRCADPRGSDLLQLATAFVFR